MILKKALVGLLDMYLARKDCAKCGSHISYFFSGQSQCVNNCLYRKRKGEFLILNKVNALGLCQDFECLQCKAKMTIAYESLNNFTPFICINCKHWFLGSTRVKHKIQKVNNIGFIDRTTCGSD